jgi:hypothetical protein
MTRKIQRAILKLLTEKAPNVVNEHIIRSRLVGYKDDLIFQALEELLKAGRIEKIEEKWEEIDQTICYYGLKSFDNITFRDTMKIGDVEVPRLLKWSTPRTFPENFNETIERLAEYTDSLEKRFAELVKEEQRKYWATIISVFGVFVAILSFIIVGLPKITTDPSLPFIKVFWFNLAQVLPLAIILAIFVLVLYFVIRK